MALLAHEVYVMKITASRLKLGLQAKLTVFTLIACLVPLLIVSAVSLYTAQSAVKNQAFMQLESVREIKAWFLTAD